MVKRVILGRSGEEKIVDLIKGVSEKASAGNTSPTGDKVLGPDEDFYWARPDGSEHSMREIDEELEGAKQRVEEAKSDLIVTQERLGAAETAEAKPSSPI